MEEETTVLKTIDSLDFDYKLDNINGKCVNCSSCYNYGHNLSNPFSFHLLCHRLVKNIEYIYSTIYLNGEELKKKRCEDFIYWVHNNVNKVNIKTDQNEINNIIRELINIWKHINGILQGKGVNESYLCDVSKIELPLNFDDLKRKKRMSDYCQNFELLKIKLTSGNKLNCEVYYDYFMKNKEAYDEVFEECHKNGAGANCPQICVRKQNNPKLILGNLRCDKIPESVEEEKRITIKECNAEKNVLQSELKQALLDASNPAFNYSDPRSVFLILFTFWGIFLTLFFLYNRTPFSSWMRNNLQKKKIVRENFDEEIDDEPIYDYSGSVNANMQNAEYNISYNSDWSPSQ